MRLLLDTQALLWWLADSPRLAKPARAAVLDGDNTVYVSAASAWEMEIKSALGKLRAPDNLKATLDAQRFLELPIRIGHTVVLRQLPAFHRDPFDRILVAQARIENLTVVTSDPVFSRYNVRVIST